MGIPSLTNWGSPKSTSKIIGSEISSTTLKLVLIEISEGSGFNVFNNNSCFKGSLFNNILILGIKTSLLKFKEFRKTSENFEYVIFYFFNFFL